MRGVMLATGFYEIFYSVPDFYEHGIANVAAMRLMPPQIAHSDMIPLWASFLVLLGAIRISFGFLPCTATWLLAILAHVVESSLFWTWATGNRFCGKFGVSEMALDVLKFDESRGDPVMNAILLFGPPLLTVGVLVAKPK